MDDVERMANTMNPQRGKSTVKQLFQKLTTHRFLRFHLQMMGDFQKSEKTKTTKTADSWPNVCVGRLNGSVYGNQSVEW